MVQSNIPVFYSIAVWLSKSQQSSGHKYNIYLLFKYCIYDLMMVNCN